MTMGYAHYETDLGAAGYAVEDNCHEPGCTAAIDRGLAYLCGGTPGTPDEYGCGRWYCGAHLFVKPPNVETPGQRLCGRCLHARENTNPDPVPAPDSAQAPGSRR